MNIKKSNVNKNPKKQSVRKKNTKKDGRKDEQLSVTFEEKNQANSHDKNQIQENIVHHFINEETSIPHQKVVIVGGGLVGGLTGLLLAKSGIQATVLDASNLLDEQQVVENLNPRVLAINKASMKLMQHADIWQELQRYQPYSAMSVWHRDGKGTINFGEVSQNILPPSNIWLGCMVEPSILNLAIQKQLAKQVKRYYPNSQVKRIEKLPKGWKIDFSISEQHHNHKNSQDNELNVATYSITTDLLIAADGANSLVREQAMIGVNVLDYQQIALTCAIRVEKHHQCTARQVFLPTGPLAFLPMQSLDNSQQGYWISVVWTLPKDLAEEYLAINQQNNQDSKGQENSFLIQKINQASNYMLGHVLELQSLAKFPLKAQQAKTYIKDGLVVIGDAAHVIHPLAGQGVNLGCLDAGVLVDYLLKDWQHGAWASPQVLAKYERNRKRHNHIMMHSMSLLNWINKTPSKSLQWMRNEGMSWVADHSLVTDFFTKQASGLSILRKTKYF